MCHGGGIGIDLQAGRIPLPKEGRPRRYKIVALPQVTGAAGVVSPSAERPMHVGPRTEAVLWKHLQRRQLLGKKFRRQHSIHRYFVDYQNIGAV